MTKLSIIIPVYNLEDYVGKCLDSILKQSFQDYEILVIDDGSKDNTGKICDKYAGKDERIRVIHKENEGVSVARNTAIPMTKGEYILFFDGDDYIDDGCLELLWNAASESKADGILYGYRFVKLDGGIEEHYPMFSREIYEGKEIMQEVLPQFVGVSYQDIDHWIKGDSSALKKENSALWRSMVKGDLIRKNGILFLPSLKVGEDTCFTTEYLSYCKKVIVLRHCLYNLVERKTSAIYTYEKNPLAVLKGKTELLFARRQLTDRIRERTGENIESYWYGTVVMSVIQLAFMLARRNKKVSFLKRYRFLKQYIVKQETKHAIARMPWYTGKTVKCIPFIMLKFKLHFLLYCCVYIMNLTGYVFQR